MSPDKKGGKDGVLVGEMGGAGVQNEKKSYFTFFFIVVKDKCSAPSFPSPLPHLVLCI